MLPAVFMVCASFAGTEKGTVITCFTLSMGLMGAYYAGIKLNSLDLAPNYAGSLMAIVNGCGAITGFLSPYVAGKIVPNVIYFLQSLKK